MTHILAAGAECREFLVRAQDVKGGVYYATTISVPVVSGGQVKHIATASIGTMAHYWEGKEDLREVEVIQVEDQCYTGLISGTNDPLTYSVEDGSPAILNIDLGEFLTNHPQGDGDAPYPGQLEMLWKYLREDCVLWSGKLLAISYGAPLLTVAMYDNCATLDLQAGFDVVDDYPMHFSLFEYKEACEYADTSVENRNKWAEDFVERMGQCEALTIHVQEAYELPVGRRPAKPRLKVPTPDLVDLL